MTGTSKRSRRPTVHRGVELRCGMRFEDEARADGPPRRRRCRRGGTGALCGPVVARRWCSGDGFDPDGPRRLQAAHPAPARGARRAHPRARPRLRGRLRRARGDRPRQHPEGHPASRCAAPSSPSPRSPTSCWWTPSPCPASTWPAAGHREGRRALRVDRRRLDRGQGRPGRPHARPRPRAPGVRSGPQHGLRRARSTGRPCAGWAPRPSTAGPSTAPRRGSSREDRGASVAKANPLQAEAGRGQAAEKAGQLRQGDRPLTADRQGEPEGLEHDQPHRRPLREAQQPEGRQRAVREGRQLLRRRRLLPEGDRGLEEGPQERPVDARGQRGPGGPLRASRAWWPRPSRPSRRRRRRVHQARARSARRGRSSGSWPRWTRRT